jgi:hypothetical protein
METQTNIKPFSCKKLCSRLACRHFDSARKSQKGVANMKNIDSNFPKSIKSTFLKKINLGEENHDNKFFENSLQKHTPGSFDQSGLRLRLPRTVRQSEP